MSKAYRPSHADATYDFKYGVRAVQVPFLCTYKYKVVTTLYNYFLHFFC
jgi:hypothetical protein